MWLSSGDIILYFARSVLFGSAAGVFYDVFRILRVAFRRRGEGGVVTRTADFLFCFFGDIVYWLCLALSYSIFVYWACDGRLRLISVIGLVCGFALYFFTLGRLVIAAVELIIRAVRFAVGLILKITLFPLARLAAKLLSRLGRASLRLIHARRAKKLYRLAGKGFEM